MSAAPSVPRPRRSRRAPDAPDSGLALAATLASSIRLLNLLLGVLIAIYLGSGITRVGPHEDAVIYRLGRLQPEVHPPGLLLALPEPFDRVVKVPTRTQHELFLHAWSPDEETAAQLASAATQPPVPTATARSAPELLAVLPGQPITLPGSAPASPIPRGFHPVFDGYTLTGDANIVQTRFTVRYRINNPHAWLSRAQPRYTEALISAEVYAAATAVIAATAIDDALGVGLESLRTAILGLAQQRLETVDLGVELVAFEVNLITPPQPTAASFADVTSAQVEASTTIEQARTYQAQIRPEARGAAFGLRRRAEADAAQLLALAQGETSSFLALLHEYRAAPDVVRTRLRHETVETVLNQVKTRTVLPAGTDQLNLVLPNRTP